MIEIESKRNKRFSMNELCVGTALFEPISETYGYQVTFFACSVVALLGLLLTFLIPETKKLELKSHFGTSEEYSLIKPQ
jgi:predicted MFS family arabinose efflux permease